MKRNKSIKIPTTISISLCLLCFFQNSFSQEKNPSFLTLETAMNMAENYAFSARIAAHNEEISQGKKNEFSRSMLPNITLAGDYLKYSDDINKAVGAPAGAQYGIPAATASSAQLTLTQPLVGLLPLYLSLKQASAQTEAALHQKEHTKAEARLLGANSFINAIKAMQLLAVAESSLKFAQVELAGAIAYFNAGRLTNANLLKFKLNLENTKTNFLEAQTTSKITLLTLAETIGSKETQFFSLPENYTSVLKDKKLRLPSLSDSINTALLSRNDLQAAKSSYTAAKYGKSVRESSYLPIVDFIANYSRNLQATDIHTPAVPPYTSGVNYSKEDIQDTFYYGIQFSWNLLDWGVRQAQISEAVANIGIANTQEEQMESQIKIDVTNNYLKLNDAYQTLDSAKVSVEYAQDMLSQVTAQFNYGQATTIDLLSASSDQTSALAKLVNATGDLDLAWLNLQKSMGNKITTLSK